MSETSREHVEAVARSINPEAYEEWPIGYVSMRAAIGLQRRNLERNLASLLTSTDPAVWDALAAHIPMDALVRTGRLRAQVLRERCSCGVANTFGHVMTSEHRPLPDKRRFVTEWTEAPDA